MQAFISLHKFDKSQYSHTAAVELTEDDVPQLHLKAMRKLEQWSEVALDWLKYGTDVHIMFYEKVKADPITEMSRLLEYLKIEGDVTKEQRLKCLARNLEGKFHREKSKSETKVDLFPQSAFNVTEAIDQAILRVHTEVLRKTGQGLPLEQYAYYQGS